MDSTTALEALKLDHTVDSVQIKDETNSPRYIHGRLSSPGETPTDSVKQFLEKYGDIYGIGSRGVYRILSVREDSRGNNHVRVGRIHHGIVVNPSRLTITVDSSGVITRVKANWPSTIALSSFRKPKFNIKQALDAAAKLRKEDTIGFISKPAIEFAAIRTRGKWNTEMVWNFVAQFQGAPNTEGFLVSAQSGKVLQRYADEDEVGTTTTGIGINNVDETAATPVRTIQVDDPAGGANLEMLDTSRSVDIETRDMAGATSSAGAYALCADDDGDGVFNNITNAPRGDSDRPEVSAQYNTGLIHDYFARNVTVNAIALFGRDGFRDDPTQIWTSLVHRDTNSISSFFSRSARLIMHGDGDGINMTYKSVLDTCAHEWGHGVQASEITGTNPNGGYNKENDENFVVSEGTGDWYAGCISKDGWRFAAIFDDAALPGATFNSTGSRLRGFQDPSAFGQPDHYQAGADTGGVGFGVADEGGLATSRNYQRVGILDKAAFLAAAGGTHPAAASDAATYPQTAVYGMGVTCFENIYYYAQINYADGADQFAELRQDMIDAANVLYPDSCKANILDKAFNAVGIYADGGTTPPTPISGPDPMITPWGARTGSTPYWQSPDIYVKDAADAIADPLKGQVNRLFANISNVGDVDAVGVEVTFSFKPYGAGTSGNAEKVIGTVPVDVPVSPPSTEVEIAWDLTDLTDTNGGLWPLPLGDFDHFCVIVRIEHVDDVDICNNEAQNNFGNIGTAELGDGDGVTRFVIGNSSRWVQFIGLVPDHRIDGRWKARLELSQLLEGNITAITELMKKGGSLPWLGNTPGAMIVPLRAGEMRPVELHWTIEDRTKYSGKVYGCISGRAESSGKSGVNGKLLCRIEHLELNGKRFKALIVGRVVPKGPIGTKNPNTAIRGTLKGKVDRKTGKFEGSFAGLSAVRGRERKVRFAAEGKMAATASFSFAVISSEDDQGIDLAVPLLGDLRRVCSALNTALPKRRRKRQSKAKKQTKSK